MSAEEKHSWKILKKILKVIAWITGSIIMLLVLIILLIRLPVVQNFIAGKVTSYLSSKTGTRIEIGRVVIVFPKTIHVSGIYAEDKSHDTIIYAKDVYANISIPRIISGNIDLRLASVSDAVIKVRRLYPDTLFNYSFILKAFSSGNKKPKPADTTSKSQFSIGRIRLDRIRLLYDDTISGIKTNVAIGALDLRISKMDLEKMDFRISSFKIDNSTISLNQSASLDTVAKTDSTPFSLSLSADAIKFTNLKVAYRNYADTMSAGIKLGELSLDNASFRGDTVSFSKFSIGNTFVSYDKNNKKAVKGFDFNHLLLTGINLKAGKTTASPRFADLNLEHFAMGEKSGFLIREFRTRLHFDQKRTELAELDLQTGNSRLRTRVAASYPSLSALTDSLEKVSVEVNLDRATFSMKDVVYFMPGLAEDTLIGRYRGESAFITGNLTGTLADLTLENFDLTAGNVTRLKISGNFKNVTIPGKLYADAAISEFSTSAGDIAALVPPGMIPANVAVPEFIEGNMKFRGTMKDFKASADISSTSGSIEARITMFPGEQNIPAYDAHVVLHELNAGKLMKMKDPGPVSLDLTVKGSGLDTATISAKIDLLVSHILYNGYDYHDFRLNGTFDKMTFDGTASMVDSAIAFSYKGKVHADPANPAADMQLYLKGADLKALHFSDDDFRISGNLSADVKTAPDGNILGKISFAHAMIIKKDERLGIDSVNITSTEDRGKTHIDLKSPGLLASLEGKIIMKELPAAFSSFTGRYFGNSSGRDTSDSKPQNFTFSIKMSDPELLMKLVPSIRKLTPFEIAGSFDNRAGALKMSGSIEQVIYSGITVDTLSINVSSGPGRLKFQTGVASVFNNMIRMENVKLNGDIGGDSLKFSLSSDRADSGTMISLSGNLRNDKGGIILHLDKDLVLSGTTFAVAGDNYIQFAKSGMIIHRFDLDGNGQKIAVNSADNASGNIGVKFTDFGLGTISKIIEKDTQLVRGTLNGTFNLTETGFTSDMKVTEFSLMAVGLGDLELKASADAKDVYQISLGIKGAAENNPPGNDLLLSGTYTGGKNTNLDLNLDIRSLALKSAEPFTSGQITRMGGAANGNVKITGSPDDLELNGEIAFRDAAFSPKATGAYIRVENNSILLRGKRIAFNNFTITDTVNNKAVINGYADITNPSDPGFNLSLSTRDFLAMNTQKVKDQPVYGKVLLDSDVKVTGTVSKPVVDAKVRLNEGTNVTMVNPENKAGIVESEGLVVFTDSISRQHPIMTKTDSLKNSVTELNVNATIELTDGAILKMMVDPAAGDSLYVQGSGIMDFTLDPSGTMSLTGRYTISKGGYHLTISGVLKRDFKIEEGSSVNWNGDIMEAETDITAIYQVETSPLMLVEDQLSGADDQQKNKFRNKLKFMVRLMMSGVIRKPDIHFDIDMDPKDRGAMDGVVYAKLEELKEDESALNKQVFSLLALNRFMGEDPLESGGAPTTVSSAARSSASKLLTDQLNGLADRYVKGVDLEVGVKSYDDYSSGQAEGRTELQLGVSKELMQGRINVKVGGSLDVEGQRASQNDLNDIAGDITIEYKITEDGRWKLKGFRTNEYENPIEGELTKTGVGVMFTRDFNKIKDLYQKENRKLKFEEKK